MIEALLTLSLVLAIMVTLGLGFASIIFLTSWALKKTSKLYT